MLILITGGAGFIGSALIRHILNETDFQVVNIDKLTYAGNLDSIPTNYTGDRYHFEQVDVCDAEEISRIFKKYQPQLVMHLAAESHVDRSIENPDQFILTNILGTYNMLEQARVYFLNLSAKKRDNFVFHHISTDEVFGDLTNTKTKFTETTPYAPSSPYSASKASSDHLVRSWGRTYNLPFVITNCSNNYGPCQFPEKLIPQTIINAINGKEIPIYGNGLQVRDWLYVEDHARALLKVASEGEIGQTYNIGGNNELSNIEVVRSICSLLEELNPDGLSKDLNYSDLITFVEDRPGHDLRYAIDATKIQSDFGWFPEETFESGLYKTVRWYLDNKLWWERVLSGAYRPKE